MTAALLALLAPLFAAQSLAGDLPAGARSMTSGLLASGSYQGKSVAVGAFKDASGDISAFSARVADWVELSLEGSGLRLKPRKESAVVIDDWKLGAKGLVGEESAVQLGKTLGVDLFVAGTYAIQGSEVELKGVLMDAKTGAVLARSSAKAAKDKDSASLDRDKYTRTRGLVLRVDKARLKRSGPKPTLDVELWADQEEYSFGDKLKIHVKTKQDCYLSIIDIGTSGGVTLLFPNEFSRENWLKAGETKTFPEEKAGFDFDVNGPAGVEVVRAVCSKEPGLSLKDLEASYSAETPYAEVKADLGTLTRDISVARKGKDLGEWGEAFLRLGIRPKAD